MNILFVGGSNLVLTQGFSLKFPSYLTAAGVNIESVSNISVGATGSLYGLENLTTFDKPDVDLIVIEYGINDLPTYSRDKVLWEQGFAGLLALARSRYPEALIVTLLLGRRDEKFWHTQGKMHVDMTRLSAAYGAGVIDMDALFKSPGFRKIPFESLYLDASHFVEPLITGYIAQHCALEVLGMLHERRSGAECVSGASLPAARAKLVLTPVSGMPVCFSNSRFSRDTSFLEKNSTLTIDVPGIPVGVSFVSAKDACSVRIDLPGQAKILHTLKRLVDIGKFSFIVKHVPLLGIWNPEMPYPETTRVRLQAIDCASAQWDETLVQKTYDMIPSGEASSGIYLCAISSLVPCDSTYQVLDTEKETK